MQRDVVRLGIQFVQRDHGDIQLLSEAGSHIRIVRHHLHPERERAARNFHANPAQSNDAQRLAAKLGALQRLLLPFAGLHGGVGTHQGARHGQHQSEGVFRDGNRIAAGSVHHHDAALGGGVEIDVVDTHARASDDAQLGSLVHHGRIDEGCRADNDGVGVGQLAGKSFLVGTDDGPVAVLAKDL